MILGDKAGPSGAEDARLEKDLMGAGPLLTMTSEYSKMAGGVWEIAFDSTE